MISTPTLTRLPIRAQVREYILEQIYSSMLGPGDSINMSRVAGSLDISVTPLREALIELHKEGFLDEVLGRGFQVRPLDSTEAAELYQLLGQMESRALAEVELSRSKVEELKRVNARLRRATRDAMTAIRLDTLWHETLFEGVGETLQELLRLLRSRAFRYECTFMRDRSRVQSSAESHTEVLASLERGQLEQAAEALRANWEAGLQVLLPQLESQSKTSKQERGQYE